MTPARFIPPDSTEVRDDPDTGAVVYTYDSGKGPCAIAYHSKASKADWRFRFRSDADRQAKISQHFANIRAWTATVTARRAEKTAFVHGLKVGDVLYYSWGYDQTNVDFFEVVSTTAKTVSVRAIGGEQKSDAGVGPMSGHVIPRPGHYCGEPTTKRVCPESDGPGYLHMAHGIASRWDGTPQYVSWYA